MTINKLIAVVCFILFAPIIGGLLDGFDRKISARMQRRVGPPILQPFYDLKKMLSKQNIAVQKAQTLMLISYLVINVVAGSLLFSGTDILLAMFVLSTASIFLYFAGMVTYSPYSTVGATRELLQVLAYEPAELLAAIGFYLAVGSFKGTDVLDQKWMPIVTAPGFFIAFAFVATIKMRKSPFDESTAHHPHQEIIKGLTTEMGAKNFALFTITEWYENVFTLGIIGLFFLNSNPLSWIAAVVAIILLYFIEILIDNSNARVKVGNMIKQAWFVTFIFAGVNLLILMLIK